MSELPSLPIGSSPIEILKIQWEFGGTSPIQMNEYYRNGAYVTSNNTNVPTSGTISFANFYGAEIEIVVYITANSTNVSAYNLFGSYYNQNVLKRLVINPGVTVGASDRQHYALDCENSMGGRMIIENYGSILGAGGYANGGSGGPAIAISSNNISINNQGFIYAGGGGGGQGGWGGYGGWGLQIIIDTLNYGDPRTYTNCNDSCKKIYGNDGSSYNGYSYVQYYWFIYCGGTCYFINELNYACASNGCRKENQYYYRGGAPGQGGSGGTGRGSNNATLSGSAGANGASGDGYGSGAGGQGGTGGNGGDWGAYGSSGNTGSSGSNGNNTAGGSGEGGSSGGSPGYYIVRFNGSNFSWINTGSLAGWLS